MAKNWHVQHNRQIREYAINLLWNKNSKEALYVTDSFDKESLFSHFIINIPLIISKARYPS